MLSLFVGKAQYNLNGYWEDQNGDAFYITQSDNTIYWFAEHKNGNWANVFKGTISNNTQASIFGNRPVTIYGDFYDVPKGGMQGSGRLTWKVKTGTELLKQTGSFGSTILKKKSKPRVLPGNRSEQFSGAGITGLWTCNDGGNYYVREVGNKVVWYGELVTSRGTQFSNVGFGTKNGSNISIDWMDVPKGNTAGKGTLQLRLGTNTLTKINGRGFSGSQWKKRNKVALSISIFDLLMRSYASKVSLHLNNYTTSGGNPRWFKQNDAFVNLPPEWGGRFNVNIPEITHEATFRNYHYYVSDLNSIPRKVTAKIGTQSTIFNILRTSETQKLPVINIEIPLETEGTEIVGRCTSCPSSDKGAPDIHIKRRNVENPTIFVRIPLKVNAGKITYGDISTHFDAVIEAGGICKITRNLCNRITGYKERIPEEIDKGFKSAFASNSVKTNFENSLNALLPANARNNVSAIYIEGTNLMVEY